MVDYKDFGQRVRTMRRNNNLTQEELAEKAGISTSFLGHIERGSRIPSISTIVRLCRLYHVSADIILDL